MAGNLEGKYDGDVPQFVHAVWCWINNKVADWTMRAPRLSDAC